MSRNGFGRMQEWVFPFSAWGGLLIMILWAEIKIYYEVDLWIKKEGKSDTPLYLWNKIRNFIFRCAGIPEIELDIEKGEVAFFYGFSNFLSKASRKDGQSFFVFFENFWYKFNG